MINDAKGRNVVYSCRKKLAIVPQHAQGNGSKENGQLVEPHHASNSVQLQRNPYEVPVAKGRTCGKTRSPQPNKVSSLKSAHIQPIQKCAKAPAKPKIVEEI